MFILDLILPNDQSIVDDIIVFFIVYHLFICFLSNLVRLTFRVKPYFSPCKPNLVKKMKRNSVKK